MTDHSSRPSSANTTLSIFDPLPDDDSELEADTSAYTDSSTLRSSIVNGLIENGRVYQTHRDSDILIPSDERQFGSMNAEHLAYTVIESLEKNPYFRSPISGEAKHAIDLGTGEGSWAISVADRFPNLTVRGVDLYPPPQSHVPPNCIFEVDDFTSEWTWPDKFDLVHIRLLNGSLPTAEWDKLYKRAYDNLNPGGWIEHTECNVHLLCADDTLPLSSLLAKHAAMAGPVVAQTSFSMAVPDLMRAGIESAGFTNVREKTFKMPLGDWAKHPIYKEAGRLNMMAYKEGLEGWLMYALTRWGLPEPWEPDEVTNYVAKLREELDQGYHIYQQCKKVWAQKPLERKRKRRRSQEDG